jgi:hypothetical protein
MKKTDFAALSKTDLVWMSLAMILVETNDIALIFPSLSLLRQLDARPQSEEATKAAVYVCLAVEEDMKNHKVEKDQPLVNMPKAVA